MKPWPATENVSSLFYSPPLQRIAMQKGKKSCKITEKGNTQITRLASTTRQMIKMTASAPAMSLGSHLPFPPRSTHLPPSHTSLWMSPSTTGALPFAMKPSLLICSKLRSSWFNSLLSGELMRGIKCMWRLLCWCVSTRTNCIFQNNMLTYQHSEKPRDEK